MNKKVKLIVAALLSLIIAGMQFQSNAYASLFTNRLIDDNFLGLEFSPDNWRLIDENNEGNILLKESSFNPYLKILSKNQVRENGVNGQPANVMFLDENINVPDEGYLIIEFDILSDFINTLANYDNDTYFGLLTGLTKTAGDKVANPESEARFEQMLISRRNNRLYNGSLVAKTSSTYTNNKFDVYDASNDIKLNFVNNQLENNIIGFGAIGYRQKIVYKQDGSVINYRYPINADGTYGDEQEVFYILPTGASTVGMVPNALDGYFGMLVWGTNSSISIDNLTVSTASVLEEPSVIFSDDFSNEILDSRLKCSTTYIENSIEIDGFPGAIKFNNPGSGNYIVSAPEKNAVYDNMTEDYVQLAFNLNIESFNGSRQFGVLFGLETSLQNINTEGVYYFFGRLKEGNTDIVEFLISKTVAGNFIHSNAIEVDKSILMQADEYVEIKLIAKFNGTLEVSIGGSKSVLSIPDTKIILEKRFAFYVNGVVDGENGITAYITGVSFINKFEKIPSNTADINQGFGGKDENDIPWIDMREYNLNSQGIGYNAGLPSGIFIKDGRLVFQNAANHTSFTPNRKFGDFLMQMEITDIARENVMNGDTILTPFMKSWIGFVFNMDETYTHYRDANLLTISPMYTVTDEDYENAVVNENANSLVRFYVPGAKVVSSAVMRHNIISSKLKDKTVVVRMQAVNGVFSFSYYVKGEESINMLDSPVLTYDADGAGFGHYGYISLTCTSNNQMYMAGDFSIDNFTLKNMDKIINIVDSDKPYVPNGNGNGAGGGEVITERIDLLPNNIKVIAITSLFFITICGVAFVLIKKKIIKI